LLAFLELPLPDGGCFGLPLAFLLDLVSPAVPTGPLSLQLLGLFLQLLLASIELPGPRNPRFF